MAGVPVTPPTLLVPALRVDKLLSWVFKTFEPTRSCSGNTKASRQDLPLIRTLIQSLHLGSQARLRALPRFGGDGGNEVFGVQKGQQAGAIQVPLGWTDATGAVMPALGERLLHVLLTATGSVCSERSRLPAGCRQFLQLCVSVVLQTSREREVRPIFRSVSASLCRRFSRWQESCPPL